MKVWNQIHPVEKNSTTHICPVGTKVRVWMISRMGDVGVTDKLLDPIGYDVRGLDVSELINWEIEKI